MELNGKYIPGTSYLVDYAIEHCGAKYIGAKELPETRPPFPCLTGVSNTSDSYKIDQSMYPGIVAVGVDTLELNFGIDEYKEQDIFMQIDKIKAEVISAGYKGRHGKEIDFLGNMFMVQARGSRGGYEYLIKNGDIELQIMPDARGGKTTPELRVVFRSPLLWKEGDIAAYNKVINLVNKFAFINYCQVSRADLCVDRVMPLPEIDRKSQVVTRLRRMDLYYGGDYQSGQRRTGYQFGRGGMACRFYDKLYEVKVKGHSHILQVWSENEWDGETPVSRFELQLRRNSLRLFDTNMDFITFQDRKADIWAYGTGKFLRIVNPETATRKERAKVIDYWNGYQNCAVLFGERRGVLPYRKLNPERYQLLAQATGCLASAYARLAADVGDTEAVKILENKWGSVVPDEVIEAGLLRKARFSHLS